MIYADPVEKSLETGEFYDRLARPFYLSPDKLDSDYSPVRFARELKLFRRFCPRGRVLDVGCSTGAFLYQLKTRFPADYEVAGLMLPAPPWTTRNRREFGYCGSHFRRRISADKRSRRSRSGP